MLENNINIFLTFYHIICDMSIINRILCDNNYMRASNERTQLNEIQKRSREEIRNSGIPQREIAAAIGVSAQTDSRYMTDNIFPSLDTLARLCKLLDISADYILGLNDS